MLEQEMDQCGLEQKIPHKVVNQIKYYLEAKKRINYKFGIIKKLISKKNLILFILTM